MKNCKSTVSRLLARVSKFKQATVTPGRHASTAVSALGLHLPGVHEDVKCTQEVESILDNPAEMADMYLARRQAAAAHEVLTLVSQKLHGKASSSYQ